MCTILRDLAQKVSREELTNVNDREQKQFPTAVSLGYSSTFRVFPENWQGRLLLLNEHRWAEVTKTLPKSNSNLIRARMLFQSPYQQTNLRGTKIYGSIMFFV